MRTSDVVIAGAGIIGLSAALELATHGLSVTVLEQGEAMRQASWAAAGMLAAGDPENPPQLAPLAEFSRSLYPAFLQSIEELSGHRVPLRTSVTLQGMDHLDDVDHPDTAAGLGPEALKALAPGLVAGVWSFLQLEEHSLDPRDLCQALPLAARAVGVKLHEHTTVLELGESGDGLKVATSDGSFHARHYVHCGGAWSASPQLGEDALPVAPRKGQIIAVTMPRGGPALRCVIRTPALYLVPRGDRRIVVGATVEDAGFDRTVSGQATEALLAAAAAVWPPICRGLVSDQWTGLRPATPDALPIISGLSSPVPASLSSPVIPPVLSDLASHKHEARRWVATGHFRNGILLAPGTARVLRQLVCDQEPAVELGAFRAGRLARMPAVLS